ncbi:hypothetical protein BXY80_0151 [Ichthyenterobacterium magnum]|uniref:Uncharacterized protein n=1 Tax=Ichthyenterobacterium magnum TaxID=1230530 RepID=A0A420DV87_9FLAO|nr:hypothetical protein BXY80_0151 [Ichthyenterobacterium magnum]
MKIIKKYIIFLPVVLILLIQYYDKEDKYLIVQYILLSVSLLIYFIKLYRKNKNDSKS